MKEIKAFPNRKWVIRAGIAFLVVMGLLTFFSNTIMNYSLPQVTVVYSSGGSMSSAIKGTGTIEAITQAKVIALGTRKIDIVNFGVYQDVTQGDVIATLAPATDTDKEELAAAQEALQALLDQKKADELQAPVYDYSMFDRAISDAQEALSKAKALLASAQGKDAAVSAAQAEVTAAQAKIDALTVELADLESVRASKQATVDQAQVILNEKIANSEDTTAAQALFDQATAELAATQQQINDKNSSLKSANASLTAAGDKLSAALALPSVTEATESLKMAQRSYDDAKKVLADQKKADYIQQQIAALAEEGKKKALEEAQKKVNDLTALSEETTIVAPKTGRISAINFASGTETVKGEVLVVIDAIENGFIVPITFASGQVSQMQIGMGARIDNYGGSDQDAIIVSIKPDKTDPRNNKTVTFRLNDPDNNYWFSSGSSITLSLNNRSVNYQSIVPLSAVHEESGETFVYSIKIKSSPLGERYIAVKVPVTILAKDDMNAAIDPSALGEYGSSVITETNDKSFKSGDQVRLAEGL